MEKCLESFSKSVLAGGAITIGAIIYCALYGGVAAAILFSVGLYLVLWFRLNLYTGKVGYATSLKDIPNLLIIFLGNAIGCLLAFSVLPAPFAISLVAVKLATPLYITLIKAIICGVLIYAGVEQYKQKKEYAPLVIVPSFILAGAEHSIADIGYLILARCFTWEAALFILIVAIGNAIGSLLWKNLT